ncbi:MAG: ammonium transporter [Gemmataceae bacterium]
MARPSRPLLLIMLASLGLAATGSAQDAKKPVADPRVAAHDKQLADLKSANEAVLRELDAVKQSLAEAKAAGKAVQAVDEVKAGLAAVQKASDEAKSAAAGAAGGATEAKQKGDTAWLLMASALVMFMLPGLALFYGGMVRRKNVLATMMQSMAALAVVGVYWVAVGYGLAFGPSVLKANLLGQTDGGLIGWSSKLFFLQGIEPGDLLPGYAIPVYVHVMFQGMFAIITPALISGAIAERIRFWPFCIFMLLWITLVYCPLAHMVWAFDFFDETVAADKRGAGAIGLLGKMGALDFAGGTVVHIAAGMAGLACCLVLRRRDGYPKTVIHPNGMVLTLLGAGLLWFGWFGFNGGSGLNSSGLAGSAFAATQAAAAAAGLAWMLVEWLHKGKPTALGLASGIVAGLVAVTPASGFVYVWGGLAIGLAAAVVCYVAVWLKGKLGYDDSLDAFGVHGVGGFVGAVLTGVFCYNAVNPAVAAGAKNDGFFAVRGAAMSERITELETKLIPEAKKKGEDGKADLEKFEKELGERKTAVENGPVAQTIIQIKASVVSAGYAFLASLVLCAVVQAITLGNFSTSKKDETDGLDRTEHGEVGFDYGYATETFSAAPLEPKAATIPKGNGRYDLAVEGADASELLKVWTGLCQPSETPSDPDFLAVYPYVTTVSGTKFRLRGGDAPAVANRLESLFKKHLPGKPVKVAKM